MIAGLWIIYNTRRPTEVLCVYYPTPPPILLIYFANRRAPLFPCLSLVCAVIERLRAVLADAVLTEPEATANTARPAGAPVSHTTRGEVSSYGGFSRTHSWTVASVTQSASLTDTMGGQRRSPLRY